MPCSLTPVGLLMPGHCGTGVLSPLTLRGRPQRQVPFEAHSHGLRPRCLRFAGALAGYPRKTRFRLVANLCRAGFGPAGSHLKGFGSVDGCLHHFPLSQAYPGAQCLAPESAPRIIVRDLKDELKTGTLHAMLKQLGLRLEDLEE
jgi:hypothetical protein